MATGIILIDRLQLGYDRIAWALLVLNVVVWPLVWLAGFVRLVGDTAALLREVGRHDSGPAFLAAIAATAALGSQFAAFQFARWLIVPLFVMSTGSGSSRSTAS